MSRTPVKKRQWRRLRGVSAWVKKLLKRKDRRRDETFEKKVEHSEPPQ